MKFNGEVHSEEGHTDLQRILFNWLSPDRWPRWLVYVFAVGVVLATLLFCLTIGETSLEGPLLTLFVLPILLSAYLGGLGPGLAATLVASLGLSYTLIPPTYSLAIDTSADFTKLTMLIIIGVLISVLSEFRHRSCRQAEARQLHLNDEFERQSAFLTTLLEALPSPVFYKDAQCCYLGCNAAFEQLLGVSRDEIIGKTTLELWPPDLVDKYNRADQELLANNATQRYEGRVQAADGSRMDVVFHKAAYQNPAGGLGGIIGIVEDVTARQASEQTLRESEERFRAMFELASVGMAQADPQTGRFLRVNKKMSAITGYTVDELLGMTFKEITHPEDRSRDWQTFQQAMVGELQAYHNEKRYIKKDGTIVWVNVNAAPLRDNDGQPLYSLAVIEDITARQQAEAALQESEHRFRQMTEAVDEVFWVSPPDFQSILYISPAFEKVWGWPCAELYANPMLWLETVHPEDHSLALSAVEYLSQGRAFNVEYRIIRPDGSLRWINDRGYALKDADGQVILTSGVSSDITERKQAENALRASEEKFRLAMEAIQEGVWDWHIANGELHISPSYLRTFGYDPEKVENTYEFWLKALHPEDFPQYQELLSDHLAGNTPHFEAEFRGRIGDGRYLWFSSRGRVVEWAADGTPLRMVGSLNNITDKRLARQALEESLSLYQAILESTADGILAVNNEERIVSWNRKFSDMWRISEELIESRDNNRVRASVLNELQDPDGFLARALELQRNPALETQELIHLNDGRIFERYSRPQYLNDQIVGRVMSFRDITARVKAEQILRHSEAFLDSVIEYSPYALWIADATGTLTRMNQACREVLQISDAEVVGKYNILQDNIVAEQGALPLVQRVFEKGETAKFTLRYDSSKLQSIRPNRTVDVILDVTISPVLDNQGQVVNAILQYQDITARVKAEAALRKSEAGYRRIVETANEGIWAVDLQQRTTYVNQLMAEMLGYSREEMLGRVVTDFMFPDDLTDHQDVVNRRQRGKYEQRLRRQDGSELWTIVSVRAMIGEAGEFLGSFAMLTDITERKRAEEELKRSERRVRAKLESILAPEGDIGQLDLEDIIDIQAIQALMNDFYQLTQIPMFLVDMKGPVVAGAGWQDICSKFHRVHPETCQRCLESDTSLSRNVPPGTFKLYECKNHMLDLVTPITVGGKHMGNLFLGQFFYTDKEPDYDVFRAQAREFGFDEEAYLTALNNAPRLDRQTADRAMSFFTKLAHMISLLSLSNIKLARAVAEQDRLVESLRLSEEKSRASEEFLTDIFNSIKDGITVLDLDRTIIRINPASEKFALSSAMVGRKCYEVFHERQETCPGCPVEQTLKTGTANHAVRRSMNLPHKFVEIFSHPLINRSTGQLRGVIEYVRDVTERQQAEEALAESHRELQEAAREIEQSRNMLQLIIESIPVRVFWKDRDSLLLGCNTLYACDAGFQHPEEILGKDDYAMGWLEQADLYRADDLEVMESCRPKMNIIEPQTTPSGGQIWLKTSKVPLSGSNGEVFGVLGVYEDITELKKTEERLRASLQEKEVILKEIHHRVKNNMQMISTLFDLQLKYGGDQDPSMFFRDCQNRIRSMALIHESLYHTDTLASINFRQYLEKLLNRLLASFGSKVQGIRAQVSGTAIFLGINQAVPAGLIASELIVNCLKHAFPEQQPGEIHVSLAEDDGRRVIEIQDNGIGLDSEFSLENPTNFGWLMITNLMKQLEGTITVTSSAGTICRMVF